jgi:putative endonuclease
MNIDNYSKKDIGVLGEKVAVEYLRRRGFSIIGRNVTRKSGEIDIIARKDDVFHFVEVKSVTCKDFPARKTILKGSRTEHVPEGVSFNPAMNLHEYKIRKVIRTSQWYIANIGWKGEWQVDGVLVWLRERDGIARVRYIQHIS